MGAGGCGLWQILGLGLGRVWRAGRVVGRLELGKRFDGGLRALERDAVWEEVGLHLIVREMGSCLAVRGYCYFS